MRSILQQERIEGRREGMAMLANTFDEETWQEGYDAGKEVRPTRLWAFIGGAAAGAIGYKIFLETFYAFFC